THREDAAGRSEHRHRAQCARVDAGGKQREELGRRGRGISGDHVLGAPQPVAVLVTVHLHRPDTDIAGAIASTPVPEPDAVSRQLQPAAVPVRGLDLLHPGVIDRDAGQGAEVGEGVGASHAELDLPLQVQFHVCDYPRDGGTSRVTPPMYGRSTGGTSTLPSSLWKVSSTASSTRGMARPLPFSVWTKRGLSPGAGR